MPRNNLLAVEGESTRRIDVDVTHRPQKQAARLEGQLSRGPSISENPVPTYGILGFGATRVSGVGC